MFPRDSNFHECLLIFKLYQSKIHFNLKLNIQNLKFLNYEKKSQNDIVYLFIK